MKHEPLHQNSCIWIPGGFPNHSGTIWNYVDFIKFVSSWLESGVG